MTVIDPQLRKWVVYAGPVVLTVILGGIWIAVNAHSGRGQAHTAWQVAVLAENAVALMLRRRKPVGSLAGILLVYVLFRLYAITLLPALVAIFTVARMGSYRIALAAAGISAAILAVFPYLHDSHLNVLAGAGIVAATGCSAVAGRYAGAGRLRGAGTGEPD